MGYPAVFPALLRWLVRQPKGTEIFIGQLAEKTGIPAVSCAKAMNHAIRTDRIDAVETAHNECWTWNGLGEGAKAPDHRAWKEAREHRVGVDSPTAQPEHPVPPLPKLAERIQIPSESFPEYAVGRTFSADEATAEPIRSGALRINDEGALTNVSEAEEQRRARHRTVASENAQGDGKGALYESIRRLKGGKILLADEGGNLWVATALPLNGLF